VHVLSCGGSWQEFGPFAVNAGTPPPPEFVGPVVSHRADVLIKSQHAGAVIDIFVNDSWKGQAISTGNLAATRVSLEDVLATDDVVQGTQTLCGKASAPSQKIPVKKPKPEKPKLLNPATGSQNVSVQPLFQWQDPGSSQENAAESFQLIVKHGNATVIDTPLFGTEYSPNVSLQHSANYEWYVVSKNSTGTSAVDQAFGFETKDAPAPQEVDLNFDSDILSDVVGFPRNEPFSVHVDVKNDGNVPSPAYSVQFELVTLGSPPVQLDTAEAPMDPLGGGDTAPASVEIVITSDNDVRINAVLIVDGQTIDSAFRDV
jgi:hypothetical protein